MCLIFTDLGLSGLSFNHSVWILDGPLSGFGATWEKKNIIKLDYEEAKIH